MRMKALKTFYGDEGSVKRGREFDARDANARNYERAGLAVPVGKPQKKASGAIENKAADTGPLPSVGGETGGEKPASSSPAAPARRKRGSKASGDKPAS